MPGVPFLGATSCVGMGVGPLGFRSGRALAGMWLTGKGLKFGVASGVKQGDAAELGNRLTQKALESASSVHFGILHSTPGNEERLLIGIRSVLGREAAVIGGTAADNDLTGKWGVWSSDFSSGNGVVLAVCDWPWKIAYQYLAAHTPVVGHEGVVTAVSGRVLQSIDNRPAAEVYNEWCRGQFTAELKAGGTILDKTSLMPLGVRRSRAVGSTHVLLHPEKILAPEGAITLFADIQKGETVQLMHGTVSSLVKHGAMMAMWTLGANSLARETIVGALLVYCAGNMITIGDKRDEMLSDFKAALGSDKFLSMFPFGEQGCFLDDAQHGNLMASLLVLSNQS